GSGSDLENLLLLVLFQLTEARYMFIRQLLNIIQTAFFLILRDGLLLEGSLEFLVRVPADITNGRSVLFGQLGNYLCELPPPFFSERRNRDSDHLAVVGRVDVEV